MMLASALEMVVRTDPGMTRSHNEDAVFADAGLGLAILADGMGGYNAGEVASGMAATLISESFTRYPPSVGPGAEPLGDVEAVEQLIASEVQAANMAIFNAGQTQSGCSGMATTLVLACFYDNQMTVAHAGDSRLYRLRGDVFEQLTRDHSLLQEQLDSGLISAEEARHSHNRNLVTRGLGVDPDLEVEIHTHDLQAGDLVLLCSDGLNDMVQDEEIALTLQTLGSNPALAADELVELANGYGGRDNISVILVKILGDSASPVGWWQWLSARLK